MASSSSIAIAGRSCCLLPSSTSARSQRRLRPIVSNFGLRRPCLILPRHPSTAVFSSSSRRHRNSTGPITPSEKKYHNNNNNIKKKNKKQRSPADNLSQDDDSELDALEALFSQLEEDLKNDDPSFDDSDEDLCDEDLAKLERELAEALADDELLSSLGSPRDLGVSNDAKNNHDEDNRSTAIPFRSQNDTRIISSNKKNNIKKKKNTVKQKLPSDNLGEDADSEVNALEALFSQLEEDLNNDDPSSDDLDDDLCDQDLAKLENELEEALADDELIGSVDSPRHLEVSSDAENNYDEDFEEDAEQEEDPLNLKSWQLRRLAYALKDGKRKTSIKNLAGDVCLDRSIVLKLLRDPPPNLLLLSGALPDKPTPARLERENKPAELFPSETASEDALNFKQEVKLPVHVIQSNWSAQKRLKKVQLETLERVYNRAKRPTNAIVSSIVHVTNLPRKKVVKWFEDKRAEDGVPEHRRPYQRDDAESVVNS